MAQIKYKPNNWSNAINTLDRLKRWSQMTYSELNEDGEKYILINLPDNDVEEAFYTGMLLEFGDQSEENNKNIKQEEMIDLRKNKNAYRFNKEDGKWYIDLPDWTGTKGELQMVGGADTLLDHLSNNGDTVLVDLSTDKECPEGFETLKKIVRTPPNGCLYHLGLSPVWLCDVTKFVFDGVFPKRIHFNVNQ
jgi:hypothetical protein